MEEIELKKLKKYLEKYSYKEYEIDRKKSVANWHSFRFDRQFYILELRQDCINVYEGYDTNRQKIYNLTK